MVQKVVVARTSSFGSAARSCSTALRNVESLTVCGRAAIEHDHVGAGTADALLDRLDRAGGLGAGRLEAAVREGAEHSRAPGDRGDHEQAGQGQDQAAVPVVEAAEPLEHVVLPLSGDLTAITEVNTVNS